MKKKILFVINLSIMFCLTLMLSLNVKAEELVDEPKIEAIEELSEEDKLVSITSSDGEVKYYSDLNDALNEVKNGDTLLLLKSLTLSDSTINKKGQPAEFTFDLGGNKIESNVTNKSIIYLEDNSTVTFRNGTIEHKSNRGALIIKDGKAILEDDITLSNNIVPENPRAVIQVGGKSESGDEYSGTLVINDGAEIYGVVMPLLSSSIEMNGGLIDNEKGNAITGNGSDTYSGKDTTITINGGRVIGKLGAGIYHPNSGVVNINGGTIEGAIGIVAMQGTIYINGGTIIGTSSGDTSVGDSGNDELPAGASIIVDNNDYGDSYTKLAKVIINGGNMIASYDTTLVSLGENITDYFDVKAGAYSKPFDQKFIKDENELEVKIGETYYVGHNASSAVEDSKTSSDAEIEILQGDLKIEGAKDGLKVKNSGNGTVSVNDHEVVTNETYEVETPTIEEEQIENPNTGDNVLIYIVMSLISAAAIIIVSRKLFA